MRIDYRFLKKISDVMQARQSRYIEVKDLMEDVKALCADIDKEDFTDLFIGHLHLLKDNEVIKELSGQNSGIAYGINGQIIINGCYIRLTSKGYDFAKVLNKSGIIEKFKRCTLNEALQITNAVIANSIGGYLTNI